jgi:hypothetical protein
MTIVTVIPTKKTQIQVYRKGETGLSSYESWLAAGNTGTLQDFFQREAIISFPDEQNPAITNSLLAGNAKWRIVVAEIAGDSTLLFQKNVLGVWQNAQELNYLQIP